MQSFRSVKKFFSWDFHQQFGICKPSLCHWHTHRYIRFRLFSIIELETIECFDFNLFNGDFKAIYDSHRGKKRIPILQRYEIADQEMWILSNNHNLTKRWTLNNEYGIFIRN